MSRTSTDLHIDQLLRIIAEGTAAVTGDDFMRSLVRHLAEALDVKYAFVAEFTEVKTRVGTLAFWADGEFLENFEYDLPGTPCEAVLAGEMRLYKAGVQDLFPSHREELAAIGAESYLAIPLADRAGEVMGHLALIDVKPMSGDPSELSVLRIFAARAGAELERMRAEELLRRSEERLGSILASAMDAIVTIDESRCITLFNNAAERIFGCSKSWAQGQPFDRFLSKGFRNLLERHLRESTGKSAKPQPVWAPEGLTALRANREEFPIEATLSPLELGGKRYYTFILRDVDERRKIEAELHRLQTENVFLQEEISAPYRFEEMIGGSPAMRSLFSDVEQVAGTDSTVLIIGETGTGKERIAHAIHNLSPRKDRLLVKLNCAALPAELIESELFGHEKGAFTGATAQRKGRFEMADRGTLFLDEVGELSLPAQAKLLRVLQEREFERVGGGQTIRVDVRVIAATNRNLADAVKAGEFRVDLYYRLDVFPLRVPPLRERREEHRHPRRSFPPPIRPQARQASCRHRTGIVADAGTLYLARQRPGTAKHHRAGCRARENAAGRHRPQAGRFLSRPAADGSFGTAAGGRRARPSAEDPGGVTLDHRRQDRRRREIGPYAQHAPLSDAKAGDKAAEAGLSGGYGRRVPLR